MRKQPLSRKFRRTIRKCNKYNRKVQKMNTRLEKLVATKTA